MFFAIPVFPNHVFFDFFYLQFLQIANLFCSRSRFLRTYFLQFLSSVTPSISSTTVFFVVYLFHSLLKPYSPVFSTPVFLTPVFFNPDFFFNFLSFLFSFFFNHSLLNSCLFSPRPHQPCLICSLSSSAHIPFNPVCFKFSITVCLNP